MTPPTPIRVLLLLQRPEGWLNIRGLWRAALADERFQPVLLVLPYSVIRTEENAGQLERWQELLAQEDAPFEAFPTDPAPDLEGFDVVVFTAPYDRERPSEFHFDAVARRVDTTVYLPYGLTTGGGSHNFRLQYGQPTQSGATLVCARSRYEKALYRKHCPSGDRHVEVVGHPRLDELAGIADFPVDKELLAAIEGRTPILWNSHFSFGLEARGLWDYSTFDRIGGPLLEFGLDNPDVALIWRPHPHLFPTLARKGMLATREITALRRELEGGGVILDQRPDYRHAFAASAAMVTDLGSFLIEYLVTEKPILYTHNPDGPGLNEEGTELALSLEVAESPAEAIAFIERQVGGTGLESRVRMRELRHRFLPLQDGRAAERILERVAHGLGAGSRGEAVAPQAPRPVVAALTRELNALQHRKARKSGFSEWIRIGGRRSRQRIAEMIKSYPRLLRAAGLLSKRAARR